MPTRRPNGFFWNNEVVGANAYSAVGRSGWGYDNFCLFLTVSAPTTITLCVANDVTDQDEPYYTTHTELFLPVRYLDSKLSWTFSNPDSLSVLIPDFTPLYFRLKNSTASVTITASWLASGD